jgi:hypothetical protein
MALNNFARFLKEVKSDFKEILVTIGKIIRKVGGGNNLSRISDEGVSDLMECTKVTLQPDDI